MTIQHTVVFRLVHEAGSPEEREFLATGRAVLTSIPGVEDFAIRRQVSPKSDLAHQFSMIFRDRDAYRAYDAHTAFVSERWVAEVAAFQEYDFEE
jgi:hypothetical protein